MNHIRFACGTLALIAVCAPVVALTAQRAPAATVRIEHDWKPVREGGTDVVAIDVRTTIIGLDASASRQLSINVPITYAGVSGIADRTERFRVRDSVGDIPLRIENDATNSGGFPYYRHWRAERAVQGAVVIEYRSVAPRVPMRGPPFSLFSTSGGVSGAGSGFLVLPELLDTVANTVHWDLSDLAEGSSAVTTFGEGDFSVRDTPDALRDGWIMAGPLGRYPSGGMPGHFRAAWLGMPAWDPDVEMLWASRLFEWLGTSYGYLKPLPDYRVFIRTGGTRGGTALSNSFMASAARRADGAAAQGASTRETFAHEMGHLFVGFIQAPDGVSSWFSEGLNVYYTRLLPMRGGFTTVEEYGRTLNTDFRDYYLSAGRNLSADSITRIGFRDEQIRHIPYLRGSLYFADLDSKIRARSRGRRALDIVMRELFEKRSNGTPITHDSWRRTVVREVGPTAAANFDAIILRGDRTIVPASDAFGPCFARRAVPATRANGEVHAASFEWVRQPAVPDTICRQVSSR